MNYRWATRWLVFAVFLLALSSPLWASETIEAASATNPAPAVAFSTFDRFEVAPIAMGSPYAGQNANDVALKDLQADMDRRVQPWLSAKNSQPGKSDPPRVLLIEPRIEKVKFVGGGARFWAGAFAGSSGILLKVRISDKATGALIAEPEFYQHAAAMDGAWSFGAADKAMLERTASLVADYLESNFSQAVGGPTGKVSASTPANAQGPAAGN